MTTRTSRAALACALLATTCLASPAFAADEPPPLYPTIDANGVDLTSGTFNFSLEEASIGSGESELSLIKSWSRAGWNDQWNGNLYQRVENGVTVQYIVFNDRSVKFSKSGANYVPVNADGSTLTLSASTFTYTSRDGSVYTFRDPSMNGLYSAGYPCNEMVADRCFLLTSIAEADGRTVNLVWETVRKCSDINCTQSRASSRLTRVTNSSGYKIDFTYAIASFSTISPPLGWAQRTSASFTNTQVAGAPVVVSYVPSSSGPRNVNQITDPRGGKWTFSYNGGLSGIKRPGATTNSTSVVYAADGTVSSITREGVTTGYTRSVNGSIATMTVTNALGQQKVVTSDLIIGRITSVQDELGRTTSYQYDGNSRLTRVTAPEGNYVENTLDARGNVTQTQAVAKPGSGAATITSSASFDAACGNPKTCNQPNSTTDARGFVTDYAYDATHGGLTSVTLPAAPSGIRPQMRYTYTLAGTEHRLTGTSACRTGASCAATADEVKSTIAHDANGNVTSASLGAGDNSLVASRTMTYDAVGNLLTEDGPLAGSADTTQFRYDAARNVLGSVSADPDGAGVLKHRAVRSTINADGQVTKIERGVVGSQSDADWAAFAAVEAAETAYDANARPFTQKLVAGGTIHVLNQTSYDVLGRPECTARRMNPAAFGSLPASACSLGTQGSFGPDRIAKTVYNAAGKVTQQQVAVGTPDEAAEVTATYRNNGQVETVTDGENNKTTYVYDGHDRLSQTQYPSATNGAGISNAADYEQLGYDSAGNVTSRRLRDGQTIGYVYDNLSRLTAKDLPNTVTFEGDASYGHDLLGRLTAVNDTIGHQQTFGYDALGRRLTEASNWYGTVASQFDLAGRRTRLTWRDGFYVTYDHLVTGETSAIRENGGFVLASFKHDDLGRRTSLTRGNGTLTGYGYDPVSRLGSLTQDLGGGGHDLTLGFSHNPASQIASNTRSNDAYAWTGHGSGTTASTANGLNQLVNQGGTALSHDAKGNVTFDGARSFGYTAENRLATGPGTNQYYDALGRLFHLSGSGVNLHYDGFTLIEEALPGGNIRRFVHGPDTNEPLVWYEGAGNADRRYLHADERGSIVAVSDNAGSVISINRYDEHGKPATTNIGRFQYTGQAWLPEIGLFYYKNRMYNPSLSRFMQADPIGYHDGMNLYAYVGGDPVNFLDPNGTSKKKNKTKPGLSRPKPDGQGSSGGGGGGASASSGSGDGQSIVVTAPYRNKSNWQATSLVVRVAPVAAVDGPLPIADAILAGAFAGAIIYDLGRLLQESNEGDDEAQSGDPKDQDLVKVPEKKANDVAQEHGFRDAHDAKDGRGGGRVNIYRDKNGGGYWIWNGRPGGGKDPL